MVELRALAIVFTLTRKTDYALIALCHMARRPQEISTAREIAERYHVPPALLMNILKLLTQAELVRSIRGSKGGYTLAMPPGQITLEGIIRATEGPYRFVQCTAESKDDSPPCDLIDHCPISGPVQRVHAKLKAFLTEVTLAELAFESQRGDEPVQLAVALSAPRSMNK